MKFDINLRKLPSQYGDVSVMCNQYRLRRRPILLHLDTNSSLCQIGQFWAIFYRMFSVKAQTVSICLSDSQPLLEYQKSIGKRMKYPSKMCMGIGSL